MKKFILNLAAYILTIAVITVAVNTVYVMRNDNLGTMNEQKNDKAYVLDVPNGIEICNLGNSHGYYGFNYSDLSQTYTCFNFALPSQTLSYDYRILENYADKISQGAYVFICISYTSFFGEQETAGLNFESKNKRYYYFLQDDYIKEYDAKADFFINYFPALYTTPTDLVKVILKGSDVDDMWNFETSAQSAAEHASGRYNSHVASCVDEDGKRIYNEEEIRAIYDIIKLCREIGAEPILITTPYLCEYTNQVWEKDPDFYGDFYEIIEAITESENVDYYDFSADERFCNDYSLFFNTDHMNSVGAKKFVRIIEELVRTKSETK